MKVTARVAFALLSTCEERKIALTFTLIFLLCPPIDLEPVTCEEISRTPGFAVKDACKVAALNMRLAYLDSKDENDPRRALPVCEVVFGD